MTRYNEFGDQFGDSLGDIGIVGDYCDGGFGGHGGHNPDAMQRGSQMYAEQEYSIIIQEERKEKRRTLILPYFCQIAYNFNWRVYIGYHEGDLMQIQPIG